MHAVTTSGLRTRDDAEIVVRRLWRHERQRLIDHLLRLSPYDRYRRFGTHVGDARIRAYVHGFNWRNTHVVGAFVDGTLRGAAELQPVSRRPPQVEAALSVEHGFQGLGVGRALFGRILLVARNQGISEVMLSTQADNLPMQRVAAHFGMRLQREHDQVIARLAPEPRSGRSLLDEAFLEGRSRVIATRRRVWPSLGAAGRRRFASPALSQRPD